MCLTFIPFTSERVEATTGGAQLTPPAEGIRLRPQANTSETAERFIQMRMFTVAPVTALPCAGHSNRTVTR
jgi:hypothetical protein